MVDINMSTMSSDQLHRSTLGIYSSLMDEFNPGLQKLVSLGNSYVQGFQALSRTSEAYYSALSKIGEQASRTMSSHSLGEVLIQLAETQRRLTLELQGLFRWFHTEVLQEMDNNIRLDRDYLSKSRRHYEMEVHSLQTGQLRRGTNQFLKQCHADALKEEERRYRFLAEKHCGMIESTVCLMDKMRGLLQQRADTWKHNVNVTRKPDVTQSNMPDNMLRMREEEIRRSREEQPLGKVPSRAPSPQGRISRSSSPTDLAGSGGGGRLMRALLTYQPGSSNSSILSFTKGEIITVLVRQARNGWLYGRTSMSSCQGWFPASYVEAVADPLTSTNSRSSTLRGSSSMNNLLSQPGSSSSSGAPPPPPPPPPSSSSSLSSLSSNKQSTSLHDKRAASVSESKQGHCGHVLFSMTPQPSFWWMHGGSSSC
ncbi:brain-specific angiogenesis inhibitor 1-associated protein 2-like protein 2 isoform X2 [Thalassophryne amazonica]|uniref:brain-specific angiogenesis inhibitor 1-associated protein 2-like protein 2 isoform X2 n=1 Tax=Thalassophryne amazonica TaxID=390379 RepID=UPI001470A5A9|nr:brain-specific angiogenesis inhibitor 1-associated protein 2-like protein 2 isoform X2 [Thalassophryne amazonica]